MSFAFSWNLLTITEVLGIVLAVIGFFNLSEKLEAMFETVRDYSARYATYELNEAKALWPPHKHFVELILDLWDGLPTLIVIVGAYIWWSGSYEQLRDWIVSFTMVQSILFWGGVALFVVTNELFTRYVLFRAVSAFARMLERVFWLLAKPPSGITGTLGLVLSIASFALSHMVTRSA